MIGLEKCYITSAYLQWLCHSGERTVARGPLVIFISRENFSPHSAQLILPVPLFLYFGFDVVSVSENLHLARSGRHQSAKIYKVFLMFYNLWVLSNIPRRTAISIFFYIFLFASVLPWSNKSCIWSDGQTDSQGVTGHPSKVKLSISRLFYESCNIDQLCLSQWWMAFSLFFSKILAVLICMHNPIIWFKTYGHVHIFHL